jgi:hypothetical protein
MKALRMGLATVALMAVGAAGAEAQRFGVQANFGTETDLGVGARVEIPIAFASTGTFSQTFLIGSFDYFFWDCEDGGFSEIDCSYWEINANAAVPLVASGINPYVGAGLNYGNYSIDFDGPLGDFGFGSGSEIGLNILGGLRFPLGGLSAYGEGRFEVGGGEQLVLTFGILLGN